MSESDVAKGLRAILGRDGFVTSAYGRAMYFRDAGFLNAEPLGVCLPSDVDHLAEAVRYCSEHGIGMTPRGAGTGLAGGAVPLGGTVVIGLSRMNRILEVDEENRHAWVEPGLANSALDRAVQRVGLRYAPDPSSQAACSIGGNVATNAGGAHCLTHGVTSWHVQALDFMDARGDIHRLGSEAPDANGYDLRGIVVGSEGTFGIVTRICVRLMPRPREVRTVLLGFASVRAAAQAVSAIIASGLLPVALELMDQAAVELVQEFSQAAYPPDAGAILLVEFEGMPNQVEEATEVAVKEAARFGSTARVATDADDRARLWKGRKAIGGALARMAPDYYLHDVVVPRTRLADILDEVLQIAKEERVNVVNVMHAGDGNLHPLIPFDRTQKAMLEQVFRAGDRIVHAAMAMGGVPSGEHGIGLEKRNFLHDELFMDSQELELHLRLRSAMDPTGLMNPGKKVVRTLSKAPDGALSMVPAGTWL